MGQAFDGRIFLLLMCILVGTSGTPVFLPLSPDSLRIGCYSNSTSRLTTALVNATERDCLRACANLTLPLALHNSSVCMCSQNVIPASQVTPCGPQLKNNETLLSTLHVFNSSTLFGFYGEVMAEIQFKVHVLKLPQNASSVNVNFGDGTTTEILEINSTISHWFTQEGRYTVSGFINQSNQLSLLMERDVIIQERIPNVHMSCPSSARTMSLLYCHLSGLDGSNINVEIDVHTNGSQVEKINITIPGKERIKMGHLAPLSSDSSPTNRTQGTYILPGLQFRDTTVIGAWEIVARRNCSVKLQVFRPSIIPCGKPCITKTFCAKWSHSKYTCNTPCIYTRRCITNTTADCFFTKPPYQSVSSFDVQLKTGYNFVQVPEKIKAASAGFGDVVGWSSNDVNCIKTVTHSSNQSHDVLFSTNQTRLLYNVNDTVSERKTFAIRIHGSYPVDYRWTYCNKHPDIISLYAKFSNQLSTKNSSATITFQKPITAFSYTAIGEFMVVNETKQLVFQAREGTNLSFVLNIAGKTFRYSPYEERSEMTDGFVYRKNVTFYESDESVDISYMASNMVSKKSQNFRIKVRIRVLGFRASLTYTDDFVYQEAVTYLNTSLTQGNQVAYDWLFENRAYSTRLPTITYIWKTLGHQNITVYAQNHATYAKYILPTRVITNPLILNIAHYVEAGATQDVGCKLLWPGGSSLNFFQQMKLTGKKGTNVPDKVELVLNFGDGKSVNSTDSISTEHVFAKNVNSGYHVQCTVNGRPDINIRRTVKSIDKISGLQIITNCPSSIKKGSTCTFQAVASKDDNMRCRWKIKDGSGTLFLSNCKVSHTFGNVDPGYAILNASNQISWLEMNKTFTLLKPTTSSIKFTSTTTGMSPTTTGTFTTITTSPTTSEQPLVSSSISPSPSKFTISSTTSILPSIRNTSLVCPGVGVVGEKTLIKSLTKNRHTSTKYEWYINDKRLESGNWSINHVFKLQGLYSVKCKVSNFQEQVTVYCKIPVQNRIDGFRMTKLEILEESLVGVAFEVSQGTNITYKIDYGDGDVTHGFLSTFPSKTSLTHRYSTPNEYLVKLSVASLVGPNRTISNTIIVSAQKQCIIYDVTLQGVSRDKLAAPAILPQNEYSISPSLKLRCESTMIFKWGIVGIHNETLSSIYHVSKDVALDERELGLPPYTLVPGLYKIQLTVSSVQHNVSKTGYGFLRVRETSLVALIECGSVQTVSRDKDVILNASLSYDPANPRTGSQNLAFNWFCREKNDSWFDNVTRNGAVVRFPRQSLKEGRYSFVVQVTTLDGRKKTTASQTINVVNYDVPDLCIRCIDNCGPKVLLFKPVILSIQNSANTSVNFKWRLSAPHNHHVTKRSIPKQQQTQFVINHTVLQPNKSYTVTLEATIKQSLIKSEYVLRTDDLPVGGRCDIHPETGKTIETPFQITCSHWEDKDRPLWYEFYYNDSNAGWMLMSYGWSSQSPLLYLPPGTPENNYRINLSVDIVDTLGSRTKVPLNVQVMGFDESDGPVSGILNGYVQGPSSKLGKMLVGGEQQQAFQLMTTISTVLNQDSSAGNPAGHSQREQVRLVMTKEFSSGCCSSLPSLRQILGGLQGATRVPKEVAPDSQINGADGYEKMAKSLATKYQYNSIDDESKGVVNGLSDILEASEISSTRANENKKTAIDWLDDSNQKGNEETLGKSNKAAHKCLTGADQVARALVSRKKSGDEPTTVKSSKLQIAVHREQPSSVKGKQFNKTGTKFVMPETGLGDNVDKLGFVDTKVLTLQKSPFKTEGSAPIASPVSSLELQDPTGNIIAVNNLSNPISIFLENTANNQRSKSGQIDACVENITIYNINITEPNIAVNLEVNCSLPCTVFWQRSQRPTSNKYDLSWNITSSEKAKKILLSWERHLNETGVFYLGISHNNLTNQCGDSMEPLVYNITLNIVGCMYWDEKDEQWSTDGCQVGPETNQQQIHCMCNHLTWFGGKFFVPPNKLDIDKIATMITDPSNYAAVLSVMCTIWAVYSLVLVWARREDKKDELKVGVCVSPSNKPENSYIYEVTVTTGIRRAAGTTANTAIIMYGEHHDSDPYLLTDIDTHRTLQRGVSHTFLLTTEESLGQLLHIRIWHDNRGRDPALFLKQISVRDVQSKKMFHFLCNRWFAVDEGDGLIDRVLPLTSDEEMAQFTQMFLSKTKKDLTDSHLWFSVVWRPPHSVFTRVQRVSCCLSLLLCTMMANAMWYKADEGTYTKVDLGPLEFSWEQVSIGIMSSLIVFPINLALVQIFRHSKVRKPLEIPKQGSPSKRNNKISPFECLSNDRYSRLRASSVQIDFKSDNESSPKHRANVSAIQTAATFLIPSIFLKKDNSDKRDLLQSDDNLDQPKKTKEKGSKGLPYWFRYVGWVMVGTTSLAATVVTLLYGIQFGKRKSEKWLLSMFVSVTQDIFVSQPIKVITIAVAFAFIIKKPQFNEKSTSEDDKEKKKWLSKCSSPTHSSMVIQVPPTKPSEETLEMARKRLQKEKQMGVILKDIISYLTFMLIMLLIAYGHRDKNSFLQKESIEGLLLRRNYSGLGKGYLPDRFDKAHKIADMWKWLEKLVLPVLYNVPWYYYSGKPTSFVEGGSGMVVGVARLRQNRVSEGGCTVVKDFRSTISKCRPPYSTDDENHQDYDPGWVTLNTSNANQARTTPWEYNSASQLTGFPFHGKVETYSGGGYVLTMSRVYYKALKQLHNAKAELWVDVYSRSVFVEFNVYNPSSNLFTACTVLMELLPTGGFLLKHEFLTYRLYRYVGDFQIFIVAMEVFFLMFITYFTYREGKKLYVLRRRFFSELCNWLELIVITLAWASIAHYFICFGIRKWTLKQYQENPDVFTNFHYISAWQVVFENLMALTVFAGFLKMVKLLSFNKRMYLFAHTLRHALRDIINFCFIFLVVFIAFSQLYFFMLGSEYQSFSSMVGSMAKLMSVMLGKFSFEEFMNPFRTLGAISFIAYMFIMKFFLLNILIVLILASFQHVKHSNKELRNDFEIIDFVVEQFKSFAGIRTKWEVSSNEENEKEKKRAKSLKVYKERDLKTKTVNNDNMDELFHRVSFLEKQLGIQHISETFDEVVDHYVMRHIQDKLEKSYS